MKEKGLFLYVCFTVLVASKSRMGFRESIGIILRPMKKIWSRQELREFARRRVIATIRKHYDMKASSITVGPDCRPRLTRDETGKFNLILKNPPLGCRENDLLYPTFKEHEDYFEVTTLPSNWDVVEPLIIPKNEYGGFVGGRVKIPLKVPFHQRAGRALCERAVEAMPIVTILMGKRSPVFNFFKYEDFTEIINVVDEGLVGDGSTDNATNFQTIVTNIPANGQTIFFPDGVYNFDSGIDINHSDVTVVGTLQSEIHKNFSGADSPFRFIGAASSTPWTDVRNGYVAWITDCCYKDLYFTGINDGVAERGLDMRNGVKDSIFLNCRVENWGGAVGIGGRGINTGNGCINIRVVGCYAKNCHEGFQFHETRGVTMTGCTSEGSGEAGLYMDTQDVWGTINGNAFWDEGLQGITAEGCWFLTISANFVDGNYYNTTGGISISSVMGTKVMDNVVWDCMDTGINIGTDAVGACVGGNTCFNIAKWGIRVQGTSRDCQICNNTCFNNGAKTAVESTGSGIYIRELCYRIKVYGNLCFDDQDSFTVTLTSDAPTGQDYVLGTINNAFWRNQRVIISDDTPNTETNRIEAKAGNNKTFLLTDLANDYTVAQNAMMVGEKTQKYGIWERDDGGTPHDNYIYGNTCYDNVTAQIISEGTNTKVEHNITS